MYNFKIHLGLTLNLNKNDKIKNLNIINLL